MTDDMIYNNITPIEVNVTVDKVKYKLREASGDATVKWRNELLKATKLGADGRPTRVEGMADTEPFLVSLCLYYADENNNIRMKNGEPDPSYRVPKQLILKWPGYIQRDLFERVKKISRLDEKETKETLEKQAAEIKAKLDTMAAEEQEKNLDINSTAGSDSPTS